MDPLTASYPWYTPYQFAGNTPIWAIDLDGLEEAFATDYYDESRASFVRKWTLNPNATEKDIGKVQFKYSDGTESPIVNGDHFHKNRMANLRERSSELTRSGLPVNEVVYTLAVLEGPTTAEKPKIKTPKEPKIEDPKAPKTKIPKTPKTPKTPREPKKEHTPTPDPEIDFELQAEFNSWATTFKNKTEATNEMKNLITVLKENPSTSISIQVTTDVAKGTWKNESWYAISSFNYLSDDLIKDRAKVILDVLRKSGVTNPIDVVRGDANFNDPSGKPNVIIKNN